MSASPEDSREPGGIFSAFRAAWVWAGSARAALGALEQALRAAGRFPCAGDEEGARMAFWRALRELSCEASQNRCAEPAVEKFHRIPEPARSAGLLMALAGLSPEKAAEIAGGPALELSPGNAPAWDTVAELAIPGEVRQRLEGLAAEARSARAEIFHPAKNPAMVAAVAGALLLVALALWNFTGRAGQFPDEIVRIATIAGRATAADFSPVEAPARDVPDWFALQGVDWVKVPKALGGLEAVGVRTFQHEGETVSQVAALNGKQRVYLLSFAAAPFGLSLPGEGGWIFKQAGKYALAAGREDRTCVVVSMPGTVRELRVLLGLQAPPGTDTPPANE